MKISKLLSLVLSLCFLAGCTEKETQVEVSSVSLNTATIEMVEGETFSLVATVLPKDAEYDGVIWASSNASVASVNSGTVTAIKEGTATITASSGGKSSTCTVKVSSKVVAVTSITLDKTSLSLKVGETETITATVNPDNATDKSVTWGSSDVSVATVADGKVTAKKSGTAIITAKSGSCIAECTVSASVDVESVTLDKTSLELAVGETATLTATVRPDDATDKTVTWTSSDESVAKVDNGKVTAVKAGKATVTAECCGKTAECAVTVTVPTGSVTLDKTTLSLAVGETAQLTATVKPDNATDRNVTWTSSDESVAKVDNGKVTALKAGKTTITAKCGGKTAECVVTVTVPTGSVTLDKTTLSLAVGETAQLTATVKPDDATDKTVVWSSSDEAVAKVENGKVTAVKSGKATITAKCCGKTAECVVTVTVPTGSVTLDKTTLSLAVGETAQLTATVKPDNATDRNVTWTSSDESVAKVDNGRVTAVKAGKATVTAKCGGKTAECAVTVIVPVSSITLDKTILSLAVGETIQLTATVKPDNATDKNVTWTSSDESVAKVADGKVTALKAGKTTITAKCGGKTAECMVTVKQPDNIIFYTSSDNRVVSPNNETVFGANIISNEYSDGIGRIIFDGPVTSVGKVAFMGCSKITSIIIPDTVSSIGSNAFSGCENLKTINTPKNLSSIGSSAFELCRRLRSFILPNGISKIENSTFYMCDDLVIKEIPSTVVTIGSQSFFWNRSLEKLTLPNGVTSIGDGAFRAAGIKELVLSNSIKQIGMWAFCDILIEKLTIPGSLTTIENTTFSSGNLSEIIVEEGTQTIGNKAFSGNRRLKKVVLPSTIDNIYSGIFDECVSMSDLYIKAKFPPSTYSGYLDIHISTTAVFGDSIDFNIWVPQESVESYKTNWQWKKYKDNIKGYDF